jgi:tetraacyldisaccharide 4'-kinase
MQSFIARHLHQRSWLSYLLWPFSVLFGCITRLRRAWYVPRRQFMADCRIISVGNITSGGAGKTPVTMWIARHLAASGKQVAVSHRGYKGAYERDVMLLSDTREIFAHARHAGDEAYLLASKLTGIPVIAGRNRRQAITQLCASFPHLDYIILDDSFQHLPVYHHRDVIVFNALGGIGNGFVLPAGILREPLSALRYADLVVFNGEGAIPSYVQSAGMPVARGGYRVENVRTSQGALLQPADFAESAVMLLSGIGLPKSFEQTVAALGIKWTQHIALADHADYATLLHSLRQKCIQADWVLTTEKDFAKLQFLDHQLPLVVVETRFELEMPTDFMW